ncbi:DinB family protein [Rufibacter roseus]|uniref:DinB family protein n=1 Tax=Rufibacter roseus TaxID=1567108 RepID=A0ABW2DSU5_9BACT|nr:DinB family protein [Rufibacter roseus]
MAQNTNQLEVWLRGPLPVVPDLLQPVAHALLQAREEIHILMKDFPEEKLWERPAGVASPAFHLQHLTGVLDRLLTYARGQSLSLEQLDHLTAEGKHAAGISVATLVQAFHEQVEKALEQIKSTKEDTLTEPRGVGRAQIPSTVIGLLVHAAEHTTRHVGQLLVTIRILNSQA